MNRRQQIDAQVQRIINAMNQDMELKRAILPKLQWLVDKLTKEVTFGYMSYTDYVRNVDACVAMINSANNLDLIGIERARKQLEEHYKYDNSDIRRAWGQFTGGTTAFVYGMTLVGLLVAGVAMPPVLIVVLIIGLFAVYPLGKEVGNWFGKVYAKNQINALAKNAGFFATTILDKVKIRDDFSDVSSESKDSDNTEDLDDVALSC